MYDDIDLAAVERKLSAARTRLILDKPFLGALVLRLPLQLADPQWCRTTATDARSFYFNAQYIAALDIEQTQFVMAHEALHCALSHFARRQHRVKQRWDISCDYAINPLLIQDGLKPPPGTLIEDSYAGMTAEEIYPYIKEDTDAETLDHHVYDDSPEQNESQRQGRRNERDLQPDTREQDGGGASDQARAEPDPNRGGAPQPPPLSASEQDALSVQWQQRLAGAAQQAMQAGKLGGAMMRMVDFMLQPQLPWRVLLARHMNAIARDDYSYTRPSTRRGEPAIFPSLRSHEVDVVVALDVSGSISDKEMNEFVSEIDAIKSHVRARVTVHACDAELATAGPWRFEPWEQVDLPGEFQGGGGTRFTPVFDWVETQDRRPDLLVYFTDGEGEFPRSEPDYPVLWLIKGKAKVPWGQRAQLN